MSRLPRASFALLLALLPATGTLIAALVLAQIPGMRDILGVGLVMADVAIHRPSGARRSGPNRHLRECTIRRGRTLTPLCAPPTTPR